MKILENGERAVPSTGWADMIRKVYEKVLDVIMLDANPFFLTASRGKRL